MGLENKVGMVVDFAEKIKGFVADKLRPEMTFEIIKEMESPLLNDLIKEHEARGFTYNNGRFAVKYVDKQHFQFEFEMYFQDADGLWHECSSESDLRDAELLEKNTWTTIKTLRIVMFPIEKDTSN